MKNTKNNKTNKLSPSKSKKDKKYLYYIIIGLVSGFFNGIFGAGGGCVVVPAMEKFLKMDEKKSHATAIGVILLTSFVSMCFYLGNGQFDMGMWLKTMAGGLIGGGAGAIILSKISVKYLKIIFGTVIIITSVKMIF